MTMAKKAALLSLGMSMLLATPARAEWLEAKSRHFTLVGDVSEQLLRRRMERLERFDALMRTILPPTELPNLPVLIVDTPEDVRRLAGVSSNGLLAFFSPSPFGVFAVSPAQTGGVGGDSGITAEMVMFHEYVHHMLLGSLDERMPRWMSEGMAEVFMNSRLEADGGVTIGLGNDVRGYSLNRIGRWSAQRLFESDINPPTQGDVDQVYAKGWLVLHYLLFSGKREGEFAKFSAALKRGLPQLEAARAAFGDLDKLENELEYYRRRTALPALRVPAAQIKVSTDFALRKLDPGEAEIMPLRMQSMVGVNTKTAPQVAASARPIGARHVGNAFVQRAIAEMEYDARNYDLADQAIDRALAASPDYVDGLSIKGLLMGARAKRDGNAALWRSARSVILKANRLAPDTTLPFILYFDSFVAAGAVPPKGAVDGLMRAIVLQPTYEDLRIKVGLHLIATGDAVRARDVLAPVALSPHRKADSPLAKLVAAIDAGTRGDALIAKVAELKVRTTSLFDQPAPDTASGKDGG